LAFQYLVSLELFDWPTHIAEIASWLVTQPELLVPVLIIAAAPLGAVGGLAGLAALAAIPPTPAVVPPVIPATPLPAALPLLGSTPLAAPAVAPAAPTPAPAPAPTTVTSVATPAPPAAAGPGFFPPYVVGPPRLGASSGMSASASSSAKRKAPEPDSAAAAAAAPARGASRAKRRQRARQRDYGDEFMDMNVDVSPDWGGPPADGAASDRGAGALGFAGTARREGAATGLITLAGDEFGGGPAMPMMPTTWDPTDDER
jgi:PPE-repeat protein